MNAEYITHCGTDLTVVNAARVSFNKESEFEIDPTNNKLVLSGKDKKLIKYLATHNHWTPFAHPQITMRETVPIFVARQRFKHMIGFVYNEISRRYSDDDPQFFRPVNWRKRHESAKQGSSDEIIKNFEDGRDVAQEYEKALEICEKLYKDMIADGVAPEMARMVLPQSMYTSYYVTGSLAAWARAYKQRIDSHAQKEISILADYWDVVLRPLFPVTWKELTNKG